LYNYVLMEIKEFADSLERQFLDSIEGPYKPPRTLDVIATEKKLHHGPSGKRNRKNPMGLDRWSKKHKHEVRHIGSVPYWPSLFPDQMVNVPYREITAASVFLPEAAYLRAFKKFYDISVGSCELADSIIDSFDTTEAFADGSGRSITDWAIECLENDISFGITSAHIDGLSDIADMEAGLSLAVAARKGRKYINNFKLLINKNMTRESYKKIPLPWLLSIGLVPYWGIPPGRSLEGNGIPDEVAAEINKLMIEQYKKDRKLGSVALGFVLAGSRPDEITNSITGELEQLMLPEAYTGSFAARCDGGIVVANRVERNFEISNVIDVTKKRGELVDELHNEHATQAFRLKGIPVGYIALSGESMGKEVIVAAA